MSPTTPTPTRRGAARRAAAVAVAAAVVAAAGAARAADNGCPSSTDEAYAVTPTALTGPAGAELTLRVTAKPGCEPATELKKVQVKTYDADGGLVDVANHVDVAVGSAIPLGHVPRARRIEADALVQTGTPPRTYVVRAETTTQLRPDLVVAAVNVPAQTLATRPVTVVADVAELNGDTGATATATLAWPGGSSTAAVAVAAGGHASATFPPVTLAAPVKTELKVTLSNVAPAQTDDTNDTRSASVEVTEHELETPFNVLFPSLGGYGAQFNHHLYAPISAAQIPAELYPDVEAKMRSLRPQLVRIFYSDNWEENADGTHPEWRENYASFVDVVRLAQESGAIVDISYQNLANARRTAATRAASMKRYADALEDLVRNHALTNVRWAEVGNEPNSGAVTLVEYNEMVRNLHAELTTRGLRSQIHLMGGGLVENAVNRSRDHYEWMDWIGRNMNDVLDAYAEHVYWRYDDPGRLEYRLRDTWHLMNDVIPPAQRKPTFMMEFGIRGYNSCPGAPAVPTALQKYYRDAACTDIWDTNVAAFQQLWFAVHSAQLGVAGAAKWDAYWAVYDRTSVNSQYFWMTGPPSEGYPLTPTYHAMKLLYHVTSPGWELLRVLPWDDSDDGVDQYRVEGHSSVDTPEKELVAYHGPNGELTVIGLDTRGRDLNGVSSEPAPAYSVGNLPANTNLTLVLWNATGDGRNVVQAPVPTDAAGVARFSVPLHAAFALTTLPQS